MNTCESCTHLVQEGWRRDPEFGRCALCRSEDGRPIRKTLAYAIDAETYAADLEVHLSFGCNQWEARDS